MKRLRKMVSLLVALCLVIAMVPAAQASFVVTDINVRGEKPYMIVSDSGYVLDNTDSNPNRGTPAQVWQPSMARSELWYFFRDGENVAIKNAATGLLLETRNSATQDWAEVGLWTDAGIATQRWLMQKDAENDVYITNANSGKHLSVANGDFNNGTRIIQHGNFTRAEEWHLLPIERHESYYQPVTGTVNVQSTLNVRFGPDTEFPTCGSLQPGAKVQIEGRINDFYALQGGGFVHCDYINISKSLRTTAMEELKGTLLDIISSRLDTMEAVCSVGSEVLSNKSFLKSLGLVAGSFPSGFATAGWNVLSDSGTVVALATVTSSTSFASAAKEEAARIRTLYGRPLNDAASAEIMSCMVSFLGHSKAAMALLMGSIDEYADLADQPANAQIAYLINFVLEGAYDGMLGNLGGLDKLADVALAARDIAGDTATFAETFLSYTNVYEEVKSEVDQLKAAFDKLN